MSKGYYAADDKYYCKACDIYLPSFDVLMKHKASKRVTIPGTHIHCGICGMDFVHAVSEYKHIQEVVPSMQCLHFALPIIKTDHATSVIPKRKDLTVRAAATAPSHVLVA